MGAAIGAIILRREREIVTAFREARATSATAAVTTEALGVPEHLAFRKLRLRSVIREAAPGRFYLDEPAWEALGQIRRRILLVVAIIGLLVVLGAVTLAGAGS